jgi:hypothetical protein
MKYLTGLLLAVAAFLVLRYAALYGIHSVVTSASTNKAACLEMVGNTTREEQGRTYIVGSIRNTCDRKVDHVTINFKVDRPADSNLGRSGGPIYAYSDDVLPGENRQFKTMFPIGKDIIYRYDGMTAF